MCGLAVERLTDLVSANRAMPCVVVCSEHHPNSASDDEVDLRSVDDAAIHQVAPIAADNHCKGVSLGPSATRGLFLHLLHRAGCERSVRHVRVAVRNVSQRHRSDREVPRCLGDIERFEWQKPQIRRSLKVIQRSR